MQKGILKKMWKGSGLKKREKKKEIPFLNLIQKRKKKPKTFCWKENSFGKKKLIEIFFNKKKEKKTLLQRIFEEPSKQFGLLVWEKKIPCEN